MSSSMTLAQFRTAVRHRANMENATGDYSNSFITDSELDFYINQSIFELYDILIQKYGNDYFVADPYTISTDGSSSAFALPDDFYKLVGVAIQIPGGGNQSFLPLAQGSVSDMMAIQGVNYQSLGGLNNILYRIRANKLWLAPVPQNGQILQLLYVPRFVPLSDDDDSFDGISGWTEYPIVDAAIKCLQKEESDVSVFLLQKQALLERIENASENRDAATVSTVTDTRSNQSIFGGEGWWWNS